MPLYSIAYLSALAETYSVQRNIFQKEGIFVGTSSGGTFAAALEVCKGVPKGTTILCMLPDTGERYLSTPLFGEILAEMNAEELAIAAQVG